MRLVRHLNDLPFGDLRDGSVVTIGAYDGLHLGHEQLLARVKAVSEERGLPSVVMSFEPTPREFFSSSNPPARLMRFREKFESLSNHGIDIFYCPRFNAQMRDIAADAFIRRILVHGLCARHVVIGDDFRFAAKREGRLEHLQRAGSALEFTNEQVPSVIVNGVRVSSTAIRQSLWDGDVDDATAFLGQSAVMGIFAVRVQGLPGGMKDAVASVGTRPTFDGTKPLLEVHIFDFDEEIYGEYIHVDFIARLRSEIKYDDVAELVAQMHRDADNARSALAAHAA
jgi:riboflavin kinase/FMN adenylyltransferase